MELPYVGCRVSFAYNRASKGWLERALLRLKEDLPGIEVSTLELSSVPTIMITGAFSVDRSEKNPPAARGMNGHAGDGFGAHALILAADRAIRVTTPSGAADAMERR